MSKFVMKNRPKKPQAPAPKSYDVGNYVSLSYFNECVEDFNEQFSGMNPSCIMVETESDDYSGVRITLNSQPESYASYELTLKEYKVELKAYHMWQQKYKKQIEKAKEEKKVLVAKCKLERTKERLTKEMEAVEAKLEKA